MFTKEINKVSLKSNGDKRIQPIDSIKTYAYGTKKDIACEKKEIK